MSGALLLVLLAALTKLVHTFPQYDEMPLAPEFSDKYDILRKTDDVFNLPEGWTFVSNMDPSMEHLARRFLKTLEDIDALNNGNLVFITKSGDEHYKEEALEKWDTVSRDSTDEEYKVPDGWQLVDINASNMGEYVYKIGHLLNAQNANLINLGHIGFIKTINTATADENDNVESDNDENDNDINVENDLETVVVNNTYDSTNQILTIAGKDYTLLRKSKEEEFSLPKGWQYVSNMDLIIPQLATGLLSTQQDVENLNNGNLVFLVQLEEGDASGDQWKTVTREDPDADFSIPDGWEVVDINESNMDQFLVKIGHLLNAENADLVNSGLMGFIKKSENVNFPTSGSEEDFDEPAVQGDGECATGEFGCCQDGIHPAHGPGLTGCCAPSKFGCCPDHVTPASGPYFEGCDCKESSYGCCPDKLTPAKGPDNYGCGCQYTDFGCCPDQKTQAEGPDHLGCNCETFRYGCCSDGVTRAQGPNSEGCELCDRYSHGCCPDNLTPASDAGGEGCGCESSKFGCCLDGSFATGANYLGCLTIPGENCHQKPEMGGCSDYQEKWYYDSNYGGCNRFWYGGCEPGRNHYDSQEECQQACVSPRGSAVCFLKRVVGPCLGNYTEWYYDAGIRSCRQFKYGGCLGNGNRFLTKEGCENMCQPKPDTPVCKKPKAEGACKGNHLRWFFNSDSGVCEEFSYSGCMGNNNRFMTKSDCEATCRHVALERESENICSQKLETGSCDGSDGGNRTLAVWGYNSYIRRCVPFYWSGCGANENNFQSLADCERVCPTTFSPIIHIEQGGELLLERGLPEAIIAVSVKANPPAKVLWKHNGNDISSYDSSFTILNDFSLQINTVSDISSGEYSVEANNGIGETSVEKTTVIVFPVFPTLSLSIEKSVFEPGSDVLMDCKVKGYPPPQLTWLKKSYRQSEAPLLEDGNHVEIETYVESTLILRSKLTIRSVSDDDTATYFCVAQTDFSPVVKKGASISVQYGPGERCVDRPTFSSLCKYVVRNRICNSKYYAQFCCRSCTQAGFIPGGGLTR